MIKMMRQMGIGSRRMYLAAFASVALSIAMWFTKKEDDRANAERFGIFVGLWAPTLLELGKVIEDDERDQPQIEKAA